MNDIKCTYCGVTGLEPGFIQDSGRAAQGYTRWVEGALERGPLGGVKLIGRPKWRIEVFRCPQCAHLEMFARERA